MADERPAWPGFTLIALAHLALRLHALTALPGFVDEGNHVEWARAMWEGHYWLYPLAHGRGISIAYLAAFWPFEAPLWVSRAATVLFSLITLAAVYRGGLTFLGDRWQASAAAAVYAALPFSLFHDRMALADPPATGLAVVAALCAAATARRPSLRAAALTGGVVAAALLTKITAVGVLALPWLAAWMWRPAGGSRRRAIVLLGGAAILAGVLAGPAYAAAFRRYGLQGLPAAEAEVGSATDVIARLGINGADLMRWVLAYSNWPVMLALALGLLLALSGRRRAAVYLALATAALCLPIMALVHVPHPRYYLIGLPPAVLLSVWGAWEAARIARWAPTAAGRRWPRQLGRAGHWLAAAYVGLTVWSGLRFAATAYARPADLPLPAADRYAYLEASWGTGYGFAEAVEYLLGLAAEGSPILVFSGDQQVQWRALLYFPRDSPKASLYLLGQPGAPDLAEIVRSDAPVYLLWDDPAQPPRIPGLGVTPRQLTTFARPGGASRLEVFQLEAN